MAHKQDAQLCSSASEAPAAGEPAVPLARGGRAISRSSASRAEERGSKRVLCPTCIHVDHCVLYSSGEKPAWFCEEFVAAGAPPRQARPEPAEAIPEPGERKHMGLCVNCDDRDTCTFPRPEGGVWRCNEYR